jgi:hypothetical protein
MHTVAFRVHDLTLYLALSAHYCSCCGICCYHLCRLESVKSAAADKEASAMLAATEAAVALTAAHDQVKALNAE